MPLPQLPCAAWEDTFAWKQVGCDKTNCVLIVHVTDDSDGALQSKNTLPFVAPKAMVGLPAAHITATVGRKQAHNGVVPITLTTNATAMYVVLTTTAAGRFSDNAFLLEAGQTVVDFFPWSDMNAENMALLSASLRVEHLADNL
eukprot:SAG31_NODE_1556_length_7893_cov_1.993585_5_plen_144_part_00